MTSIDLNCDMGESFGAWSLGRDAEVIRHVSSANIACGFHAGDPTVMRRTVELALAHGVSIGAHPGLPDLAGFGRRAMRITPDEAYDLIVYQVAALQGVASAAGARVAHVKPHGALYNMAAVDAELAAAIARAVADLDARLVLYALAGSRLLDAGREAGLAVAAEAFVDRAYEPDGTLTPRSVPGAALSEPAAAAERAVTLVRDGHVSARDGSRLELTADTLCIHGDGEHAVEMARLTRDALIAAAIAIAPPGQRATPDPEADP